MNLKVWFLVFSFSLFAFVASSADTLPTNEDIDGLAEAVRLAVDAFMQESFELRMGYEFSGRFINQNNKDSLYKLAERAGEQLKTIKHTQQELKHKIEDYQGNDWDDRYGSTGLWRKLFADLYATSLSRCEVDFYLALAADQPQKNEILRRILGRINLLNMN